MNAISSSKNLNYSKQRLCQLSIFREIVFFFAHSGSKQSFNFCSFENCSNERSGKEEKINLSVFFHPKKMMIKLYFGNTIFFMHKMAVLLALKFRFIVINRNYKCVVGGEGFLGT